MRNEEKEGGKMWTSELRALWIYEDDLITYKLSLHCEREVWGGWREREEKWAIGASELGERPNALGFEQSVLVGLSEREKTASDCDFTGHEWLTFYERACLDKFLSGSEPKWGQFWWDAQQTWGYDMIVLMLSEKRISMHSILCSLCVLLSRWLINISPPASMWLINTAFH